MGYYVQIWTAFGALLAHLFYREVLDKWGAVPLLPALVCHPSAGLLYATLIDLFRSTITSDDVLGIDVGVDFHRYIFGGEY